MRDAAKALAHMSQIGLRIAACVFIGVFLGRCLDRVLGTSPWLLLLFSLLGVGAAFKMLFDSAKKGINKDNERENPNSDEEGK